MNQHGSLSVQNLLGASAGSGASLGGMDMAAEWTWALTAWLCRRLQLADGQRLYVSPVCFHPSVILIRLTFGLQIVPASPQSVVYLSSSTAGQAFHSHLRSPGLFILLASDPDPILFAVERDYA